MDRGRRRELAAGLVWPAILGLLVHVAPSECRAQTCSPSSLFSAGNSYPVGAQPRRVVSGDFNGDAVLDLAIACDSSEGGTISILLGNGSPGAGDGTFRPGGVFDAGGPALDLVCSDFNGDGIRDLAVANGASGTVSILIGGGTGGAGDGTFSVGGAFGASSNPEALTTADLNGDGYRDLAIADRSSRLVTILLGQGAGGVGNGDFVPGIPIFLANGPNRVAAADLNRDMIPDLIVTTPSLPRLGVMLATGGIGSGLYAPVVYYTVGPSPSDLVVRDFDSDGVPDVAVANQSGGGIAVRWSLGTGTFTDVQFCASGLSLSSLGWLDANHDGIVDLLATSPTPSQLLFLMGGGGFAPPVNVANLGSSPAALVVADFNNDCAGDVAAVTATGLVDPASNLALFAGRCTPSTCAKAPTSLAVADRPRDQGGYVRLTWHRSDLDGANAGTVTSYQAWRRPVDADWVLVADVPARGMVSYTADVPTTSDDTPNGFFVRAITGSPSVFFDSQPVVGHSVNNHWPACPPISCSFAASGSFFSLSRTLTADRYDTTFSYTTGSFAFGSFRSTYDLAQGTATAVASGTGGSGITTTINDTYWLVGTPAGQDVTFNAYLVVEKHTTTNCGFHCAFGSVSANLREPSAPTITCPGSGDPCVVLTHRANVIFPLTVSASAGIGGSVFSASGSITATLRFSGLPPGAYVLSCTGYVSDIAVPVQLSLQDARVENGVARLVWYTADASIGSADVYRRAPGGGWTFLDQIMRDGSGYLAYEDRGVSPGLRYGYRLGVVDQGEERMFGEAWLDIPGAARLALEDLTPNPAVGPVRIGFSMMGVGPARIECFDVGGRRLHARDVAALGAGHHELVLLETDHLPPGVYVLRLSEGSSSFTRRFVRVR